MPTSLIPYTRRVTELILFTQIKAFNIYNTTFYLIRATLYTEKG